jgi:hypothetical protein
MVFGRVAGTEHTGWVYRGKIDHTKGSLNRCA